MDKLSATLAKYADSVATLVTPLGLFPEWDRQVMALARLIRERAGNAAAPLTLVDVRDVLAPHRMIKDADEIATLREACRITALAHQNAMRTRADGRYEYEIEAVYAQTFLEHGAQAVSYPSIVASGKNACVLHYSSNNCRMKKGELLLIDAGCEFRCYAGDVTRTFPVGKTFTAAQRDVYEVVLAAQDACFDALQTPGGAVKSYHEAATRTLTQGLLDLKLLRGLSLDEALERKAFRRFYMHSAGHWLGLDVHDAGVPIGKSGDLTLTPGMVMTVEPGLYIGEEDDIPAAFRNIGVRIEDDVLITENGIEILTSDAVKQVRDVEALRRDAV
jgi:Xaa-Pro aminopeptidase